MATSQYPLTEFQTFLEQRGLADASVRQVLLSVRRAIKAISPDDLADTQAHAYYRASLAPPMRTFFGYSWGRFVEWAKTTGIEDLPETLLTPKTRFVHPLWSDVTDLTTAWTPEAIERMRWNDERLARAPEDLQLAAHRVFAFQTGRRPTAEDWLIPKRIDSEEPLPAWVIDTIVRSDARSTPGPVERFWAFLVETSTRRGVTAHELRQMYAGIMAARHRLGRRLTPMKDARREIEEDAVLPWAASQRRVADLIGGSFPPVDGLVFW